MDHYVTGSIIKESRERLGLTQWELAEKIGVSDKTVSKWETGRGLPDITLLEPLSQALQLSVIELMNGKPVLNKNKAANILKTVFYVCPLCGNVVHSLGEIVPTCCGVTLPTLSAEKENEKHAITVENVENELYVTVDHAMTKSHYISFIAYVRFDRCELVKLYPEQNAEARFLNRGKGIIYACCNQDGLFKK